MFSSRVLLYTRAFFQGLCPEATTKGQTRTPLMKFPASKRDVRGLGPKTRKNSVPRNLGPV